MATEIKCPECGHVFEPTDLIRDEIQKEVNSKAEVAHLVEHDLAKVGVAGSSPVFRSVHPLATQAEDFF